MYSAVVYTFPEKRDWTKVCMYSSTTDPSTVCAPRVCVASVKIGSNTGCGLCGVRRGIWNFLSICLSHHQHLKSTHCKLSPPKCQHLTMQEVCPIPSYTSLLPTIPLPSTPWQLSPLTEAVEGVFCFLSSQLEDGQRWDALHAPLTRGG